MAALDDDISALLSQPSGTDDNGVFALFDDPSFLPPMSSVAHVNTSEPSLEAAAWADSCLDLDSIFSDDKWDSFKDALLDAIDSYPTFYEDNSTTTANDTLEESQRTEVEIDEQSGELALADNIGEQSKDVAPADNMDEENENKVDDADRECAKEGLSEGQEDTDEIRDSIFKVWDLRTAYLDDDDDEDTDLSKMLNKLLGGDKEGLPASIDEGRVVPVPRNIDELVAGMGDLSLDNFNN